MTAEYDDDFQRCFLAIPVPGEVKGALGTHLAERITLPPIYRLIPPENWHITLHFLGDVPRTQRETLVQLVGQIDMPEPFSATVQQVAGFPNTHRSRLLVAEMEMAPALNDLYERLKEVVIKAGLDAEERAWRPHITLARLRRGRMPSNLPSSGLNEAMEVSSFSLWASTLTDDGSQYAPLATWHLGENDR
ncbi:RNA 2',3'-cyclic phosphodiesterase [Marinobacteraceae bacterium S3BR75-40.1]